MYGLSDQYCDQWGCYDAAPAGAVTTGPTVIPFGSAADCADASLWRSPAVHAAACGGSGSMGAVGAFLKANSTAVYLGAGLLAALALVGGRRR